MFEPRLLPFKPRQVTLSHQQYEDVMEDKEWMQPIMQQFIDKVLRQTEGCGCKWEFKATGWGVARYVITQPSPECPLHFDSP